MGVTIKILTTADRPDSAEDSLPLTVEGHTLDVLALVAVRGVWRTKDAGDGREELRQACARLGPGPAVLRDYVKSTKHYWDEAAYIPELSDQAAAWAIAARFRGLRDDDFTGGSSSAGSSGSPPPRSVPGGRGRLPAHHPAPR